MELFLEEGFSLEENDSGYKDHVLEVGRRAEAVVLAFVKK